MKIYKCKRCNITYHCPGDSKTIPINKPYRFYCKVCEGPVVEMKVEKE